MEIMQIICLNMDFMNITCNCDLGMFMKGLFSKLARGGRFYPTPCIALLLKKNLLAKKELFNVEYLDLKKL